MIVLMVILAIIAIIGFVATTALRKSCNVQDEYENALRKKAGIVRAVILVACLAIFVIAMLVCGVKIVDQTEVGIVKTFGRIDRTISGGLNFVNPISDTVEVMDLRVHV